MSGIDRWERGVYYKDTLTVEVDLNAFACNTVDSDRVTDFLSTNLEVGAPPWAASGKF
jgi:hypothetical protein